MVLPFWISLWATESRIFVQDLLKTLQTVHKGDMYTGSLLNTVLETMMAWQWARVNQCGGFRVEREKWDLKEPYSVIRDSKINYIRIIHIEIIWEHEV